MLLVVPVADDDRVLVVVRVHLLLGVDDERRAESVDVLGLPSESVSIPERLARSATHADMRVPPASVSARQTSGRTHQ